MSSRNNIREILISDWFIRAIVGLGVFLRLLQYFLNRSLRVDESALAKGIFAAPYLGLFSPIEDNQCAPAGFLLIEKFFVGILGSSEYSLRLWPLLAGIGALMLFPSLARRIVEKSAVPLATFLFAISTYLIYYSSDVKQYSSDVFVAVLLFSEAFYIAERGLNTKRMIIYSFVGVIAVWFSHPAVFVLAGTGLSLLYIFLRQKDTVQFRKMVCICSLWALSFVISYIFVVGKYEVKQGLLGYWEEGFVPFPPKSLSDFYWPIKIIEQNIINPGGFTNVGYFIFICFMVGAVSLFRSDFKKAVILFSIFPLLLVASAMRKYPINDRLVLFVVPILLICTAYGVERFCSILVTHSRLMVVGIVVAVVLSPILSLTTLGRMRPFWREDIKPVLGYLQQNLKPDDTVYIYYGASRPVLYYAERYGLSSHGYIEGRGFRHDITGYIEEIKALAGKERVWFVFSHVWSSAGFNEQSYFLYYLDMIGVRLKSFKSYDASVYLYDLSAAEPDELFFRRNTTGDNP